MAIDLGFSGQESDVNRACSAFGLDTVNYRAFPNNGPVPLAEPEPIPAVAVPVPMAAPAEPPIPDAAAPLQQTPPLPAASAPAPHLAPPEAAFPPVAARPWAPGPVVAPGNYPPAGMAPAAYPAAQPQNEALPGGGFSLLRQALPVTHSNPVASMPAFAMARAPLQPVPPRGAPPAQLVANPAANPESFGIAFGTAFNAAFGHAEAVTPNAGFQRPQG